MKFVLIVLYLGSSYDRASTTLTATFMSDKACQAAVTWLRSAPRIEQPNLVAFCIQDDAGEKR